MRFFWGAIWIAVGIGLIKYSFQLVNFFGHFDWAEQHIGGGGTYSLYKLVGIVIIFLGFMYMFGLFGAIVKPLSPLFGNSS